MFDPKKHIDKYKKINNYKYSLEHAGETEKLLEEKVRFKEEIKKMKEQLEKEKQKDTLDKINPYNNNQIELTDLEKKTHKIL